MRPKTIAVNAAALSTFALLVLLSACFQSRDGKENGLSYGEGHLAIDTSAVMMVGCGITNKVCLKPAESIPL